METTIGGKLNEGPFRRAGAGLVAVVVVTADFILVWRGDGAYTGVRAAFPLTALVAFAVMTGGDAASLGMTLRPIQGYRYWIRATLAIGGAIGAFIAAVGSAVLLLKRETTFLAVSPREASTFLLRMCVVAPAVEEATYRLVLCVAAMVLVGPRWTIAASGATFAVLHVLYGNPGPDNLVAGYFLAWAFLKSGTILVPLALHALGNLCVLTAWVAHWYWIGSG